MTTVQRHHHAFIDFFKSVGITVIVYGHVAGWAPLATFPPIYLKQLGVALFLFASGYSLAAETRRTREVLFSRLVDLYVFGLSLAILLSAAGLLIDGRWAKSNYLPFAGGLNVLLNYFPANPTTWYVATYVHCLALWAVLLRGRRLNLGWVAAALMIELVARTWLLHDAGSFIAYMALPNWLTVFVLGVYIGQRKVERVPGPALAWGAALVVFVFAWRWAAYEIPARNTFPFIVPVDGGWVPTFLGSIAISTIYLAAIGFAFAIFTNLRAPAAVTFLARNTLIVFLAHMPVYYLALWWWPPTGPDRVWWSAAMMVICLPGLALCSQGIRSAQPVLALRRRLRAAIVPETTATAATRAVTTA